MKGTAALEQQQHQQRIGVGHHIHRWFARLMEGDTGFENKPRPGRPFAVDDSVIVDTIKEDPEANTADLQQDLGVLNERSLVAF
ncbi:hypothetical protein V3C99_018500 [Haemonchus contortus]|uniref:Transposase n=1 Tax=Haemonchus contortus TaxID=6289 RepID=A0A7I4Z1Q8_HAECO|nr:unnamed protein product [Haemonchus contortus]